MERNNKLYQVRSITTDLTTRAAEKDDEKPTIEGYFAVFDDTYTFSAGLTESVSRNAFDETISGDIRALVDHESKLVLGRTSAHTLELRVDEHGLWGCIAINPNDSDAMNLYARVERGDVNQCSFGFDILEESTEVRENGDIHWTLDKVKLYEVSVCTFPAYESTAVSARAKDAEEIHKKQLEGWRERMKKKLKGAD